MDYFSAKPAIGCVLMAIALLLSAGTASAADFRIDNNAYAEGRKEPVSVSTTIFQGGLVYDFMQSPAEVIIFDPAGERFVLLDTKRSVQSELKMAAAADFVARLQQSAATSKDLMIRFLATPKFEETFEPTTNRLTLASEWVTYNVAVKTMADENAAKQYREFCDGLARLNTVLTPGSRPPFARLALNEALSRRQSMAVAVTLTMGKKGGPMKPVTIRSDHRLAEGLEQADRDRVAEAKRSMAEYTVVKFPDYRKKDGK